MRILPPTAMRDLETPRPGLPFAKPVAAAARSIRPVDRALAIRTRKIPSKFPMSCNRNPFPGVRILPDTNARHSQFRSSGHSM